MPRKAIKTTQWVTFVHVIDLSTDSSGIRRLGEDDDQDGARRIYQMTSCRTNLAGYLGLKGRLMRGV